MSLKYGNIRRTRPDGNCFFRAFSFAYIEKLLDNKEEFDSFYKRAEKSKDVLVELGFQQFTVEDFYDTVSTYIDLNKICLRGKKYFLWTYGMICLPYLPIQSVYFYFNSIWTFYGEYEK